MTKLSIGQRAVRGAEEALAYLGGEPVPEAVTHEPVDVAALRLRMGLSQAEFAARFGFSVATVRDWEQRRRYPEGPARRYLRVIEREPEAVMRALGG